ncbi:hypothetical protein GQ54DRAFT_84453 [Martensiomyces pterosporus]|nr:hypothetical protein GQ54DRAFT_84453 [Martensiomyces pterosporus]
MALWFAGHWSKIEFEWVKGHAGDSGNERAVKLAGDVHSIRPYPCSLTFGPPPGRRFWLCADGLPVTMRPNMLIMKVEWNWMDQRLLAQVRMTHPNQTINSRKVGLTLETLSWHHNGDQEFVQNFFSQTSERDATERSLGITLLFGNVPVMARQTSWYPHAYPEPEMRWRERERQLDSTPVESLARFLECTVNDLPLPKPPDIGPRRYWMRNYTEE